jgi:transcriptional regulator GlxA family with amidase domain
MERSLDEDLSLAAIATRAAVSVRTLSRRFLEQTGTTPLQWLITARIRRAQHLLETTSLSVEHIATSAGFGSATAFREQFRRVVSTSPKAYRRAFRANPKTRPRRPPSPEASDSRKAS